MAFMSEALRLLNPFPTKVQGFHRRRQPIETKSKKKEETG